MSALIAWADVALGVAILLGVSKTLGIWELDLSIGNTQAGGGVFLFVVGLLLFMSGVIQLLSSGKSRK